jgi:ribosome recycling factor
VVAEHAARGKLPRYYAEAILAMFQQHGAGSVCFGWALGYLSGIFTFPDIDYPLRSALPMALDDYLLEAEDKMSKTEQVLVNGLAGVRTGKASPALVENLQVEVYGSHMRIRELAGITTPEARTLAIQPWDQASLHPIEKAIQKSNLGLNPSIQGRSIRIFFPELSEERRQEFVKIVRKMAEDSRVAVRHVRRDTMDQLKKHGHDSGVTEDEVKKAEKELQKLTDEYIGKIDQHVQHKEKEILTV